mgnify:CR=1 FL=1
MDTFELDTMKAMWNNEIDYYIIIAATVDLKYYPPEVQEIIKTEFRKRGFKKVA